MEKLNGIEGYNEKVKEWKVDYTRFNESVREWNCRNYEPFRTTSPHTRGPHEQKSKVEDVIG